MYKICSALLSVYVVIVVLCFITASVTFAQDEQSILKLDKKWTGNFDGMVGSE